MQTFTTELSRPLVVHFDLEQRLADIQGEHFVKGMFLARAAGVLGEDLPAVLPKLKAPPRLGRFIPFADYPVIDHMRVSVLAAMKEFPGVAPAEAMRRYERDGVSTVAESTIGKVTVKLLSDLKAAYLRVPDVSKMLSPGWQVTASAEGDRCVRLSYRNSPGFLDCGTIGSLEGIALLFKAEPRIEVLLATRFAADYVIRW